MADTAGQCNRRSNCGICMADAAGQEQSKDVKVMSDIGKEVSFQLPLNSADDFPALFADFDDIIEASKPSKMVFGGGQRVEKQWASGNTLYSWMVTHATLVGCCCYYAYWHHRPERRALLGSLSHANGRPYRTGARRKWALQWRRQRRRSSSRSA